MGVLHHKVSELTLLLYYYWCYSLEPTSDTEGSGVWFSRRQESNGNVCLAPSINQSVSYRSSLHPDSVNPLTFLHISQNFTGYINASTLCSYKKTSACNQDNWFWPLGLSSEGSQVLVITVHPRTLPPRPLPSSLLSSLFQYSFSANQEARSAFHTGLSQHV